MSKTMKTNVCQLVCWAIGAIIGLFVLFAALAQVTFLAALMVGLAAAAFIALVLSRALCSRPEIVARMEAASEVIAQRAAEAKDAAMEAAAKARAKATSGGDTGSGDASSGSTFGERLGAVTEAVQQKAAAVKDAAAEAAKSAAGAAKDAAGAAKDAAGDAASTAKDAAKDAAGAARDTAMQAKSAVTPDASAGKDGAGPEAAMVDTAPAGVAADDTGAGADTGARPKTLSGPRDGGADDLKQIKGIGPKLEKMCNEMGFYHFDQIAGWTAAEVAWVDENLQGFKGRVSRDDWVEQARVLAEGGETEFSNRVKKGNVY